MLPAPLAAAWSGGGYPGEAALGAAVGRGIVRFWSVGDGLLGPELARPVDYWARFHVVKAALAACLLLALVTLGRRIWSRYAVDAAAAPGRRAGVAAGGLVIAATAVLALLVVVANVQGAIAPLSSALGLLPVRAPGPALAPTLTRLRQHLGHGVRSPAADALVHDFVVYHAAMAALAALVTASLLGAAALLWRRRRAAATQRRALATLLVGTLVLAALFAVVTAANVSTVARPVPALLGFLGTS